MGSDKEDLQRWADLVRDGKPINIDQTIRHQSARIAELEATQRELREAVKVLAKDLRSYIRDQAVGDWTRDISDEVLANPIAAAAVREAGR